MPFVTRIYHRLSRISLGLINERGHTILAATLISLVGCRSDSIAPHSQKRSPIEASHLEIAWADVIRDSISVAGASIPDAEIGVPSCPHYDGITRNLKLGVKMGDPPLERIAAFTFTGHKPFISYKVRGPKPIAYFGPVPYTLSDGDAGYAAWGALEVQCDGAYYRFGNSRVWAGTYLTLSVENVEESGLVSYGDGGCDPTQLQYDPYSEEQPEDCSGSGSGSEPPGSGTQYSPGDHTGGETVDWQSGAGNGGSSACGLAAVVEVICIDVFNEATGQWETWSCGYATSC